MAVIRITDLKLKTIIGIYAWERTTPQNVIINVMFAYDSRKAIMQDNIKDSVDYKAITKEIIEMVRSSKYFLLEKLADAVLGIVMKQNKVRNATVRVDKPKALRFARSVSVEVSASRKKSRK